MLRSEIEAKFGVENAEAIILRKLNDEKLRGSEVKKHPDLPDSIEMMQFLIFDSEVEIDQEEEVMEMLYKLAEADDSGSSMSSDSSSHGKKQKKDKKQKDKKPAKKDKKKKADHVAVCIPHIKGIEKLLHLAVPSQSFVQKIPDSARTRSRSETKLRSKGRRLSPKTKLRNSS